MLRESKVRTNYKVKYSIQIGLFVGVLLLAGQTAMATITFSPSSPNVEQNVSFALVPARAGSVYWVFGDGTNFSGTSNTNHIYKRIGTFTVSVSYSGGKEAGYITVVERRYIEFNPLTPRPGEEITFRARNFLSSSILWNFGDGAVLSGAPTAEHSYSHSGIFTVRAIDLGGKSSSLITISVNVGKTNPQVSFSPQKPRAGAAVEFTAVDFVSTTLIRWDFGDGVIVDDTSPPSITHVYNHPGTYIVRAYDNGGSVVSASIALVVYPPPSITFTPADPRPGESVAFNANYFFSTTLIRWDFGDGTVENDPSPPSITHAYFNPGAYTVRAYDGGNATPTVTIFVQVWPERVVIYLPQQVRVGENVTFRAVNFLSETVLWNFGDGSPPVQGGKEISHAYQASGMFTVTASDFRGSLPVSVPVSLIVYPTQGPRAQFSVSYIQIRFDDGSNYKVVPKNFSPLKAFAELKYEGTGNLYAQWLVDGMPVRLASQSLPFAQQTVFDSGEIPGLPTIIPGLHEVTLNIIQPQAEFVVPTIRYFVTADEGTIPLADLLVSGATRLDHAEIAVASDSVEAPPRDYFLLQGLIKNQSKIPLPYVLLRIYLEEKLIDQRLVRDLKPDEERPFESSVYNDSSEPRIIYLSLYDLSQKPGRLLFIKEVKLIPAGKK